MQWPVTHGAAGQASSSGGSGGRGGTALAIVATPGAIVSVTGAIIVNGVAGASSGHMPSRNYTCIYICMQIALIFF